MCAVICAHWCLCKHTLLRVLIGAVLVLHLQGRQEDAEEYLGFTLNGLHEEMLALKKLISPQEESKLFFQLRY